MHANYGGILQGWALSRILERLGHKVRFLSPSPFARLSPFQKIYTYPYRMLRNLMSDTQIPLHLEEQLNRNIAQRIRQAEPVRRFAETQLDIVVFDPKKPLPLDDSDFVLIGSDQIWRPLYSRSFHNNLRETFGRTALRRGIPVAAYAASFGVDNLDDYTSGELRDVARCLSRFRAVSVRELSGVELCRSLGVDAMQHIDPTLLLDRDDYEALIPEDIPRRHGVLRYFLDDGEVGPRIADEICRRQNLGTFSLTAPGSDLSEPVEQWIAAFRDADFVVTDSFHAVVFSIRFGKPFVVVANDRRGNTRIDTLLELTDLKHHRVGNVGELRNMAEYSLDVEAAAAALDPLRKDALAYLRSLLREG